jgi:hypothetical protein
MAKPTRYPEWANNIVTDGVTGLDNRVEPTAQWKDDGQLGEEPTPRQYINDALWLNNQWVEYFDVEVDTLNTFKDDVGKKTVVTSTDPTLTRDQSNTYVIMTGSTITLENVISVGGGNEQIGSTIKVRTTNSTSVTLNSGATRVGFTGTIPAGRIATFMIESLPSGTGTEWSCEISAGV